MPYDDRLRPEPLELAAGLMLGADPGAEGLPRHVGETPVAALRRLLRQGLERQPCMIAFSGGRDSSGLLALAVDVARREGLADPVPLTMRFPGVPEADESEWQETLVRELGLADWEILSLHDELDYVGPYAQRVLARHGVLWPANSHVDLLLLEKAAGGCMVDGVDGDSVLSWGHLRLIETMRGRRRPGRAALRDLRDVAAGPAWRRSQVLRHGLKLPWLTAHAQHELLEALATELEGEPMRYDHRLHWYHASRYLGALQWSTEVLAADTGAAVVRPLVDPTFLVALAAWYGRYGFRGRREAMRMLFGDVLPAAHVARTSKASFPNYWGQASRHTASTWTGAGVDPAYVDGDALRATWAGPRVDHRSAPLLQAAWLADN